MRGGRQLCLKLFMRMESGQSVGGVLTVVDKIFCAFRSPGQLRSYHEDFSSNVFIMRTVILCGEGVHPARKQFVSINRKSVVGHIRQQQPHVLNSTIVAKLLPNRLGQNPPIARLQALERPVRAQRQITNQEQRLLPRVIRSSQMLKGTVSSTVERGSGGTVPPTTMPG